MKFIDIIKYRTLFYKILYTVMLICIYRMGIFITLPYVNRVILKKHLNSHPFLSEFLDVLNVFSGGAIENASIFALGVMPYITSSIIMSLFVIIIPSFKELQKEGFGKKISNYISFMTIFISIIQGYLVSIYLKDLSYNGIPVVSQKLEFLITNIFTLTAGTFILIWISEKITQKGIGNGMSILIVVGIISKIPMSFMSIYNELVNGLYSYQQFLFICFIIVFMVVFIIFIEMSERQIPIKYSNNGLNKTSYRISRTYLPIKINFAGVMPPIFASTVLTFPSIFLSLNQYASIFNKDDCIYQLSFSSLIIFFSYFYTTVQLDIENISQSMLKSNSFIPNIRPGKQTTQYITFVVNKMILCGALYLVALCSFPTIIQKVLLGNIIFHFNGIGLLITITAIIDILQQINNQLIIKKYTNYNFF